MRNGQLRRVDFEVAIKQNVDIYGPRALRNYAPAPELLLDFGDVVVHVFSVAMRDYYRLERLWSKATPVVVVQ